ncbi:MAG: hypothetical protein IKW03_09630 [Clostridia bacterium]|nr:hypothetical protein [Clostridia bacterium]
MKEKIKLIASPFLFFGGIFLYVAIFSFFCIIWFGSYDYEIHSDQLFMQIFALLVSSILLILCIYESKKFFAMIHFTKDGIEFHTAFKKPILKTYKQYRNVVYASYWHGSPIGVGSIKWFIVISERKLSKYESEHINQIPISSNVLKIEYSKKRREKLMEILPQNMACQLKNPPPGKK